MNSTELRQKLARRLYCSLPPGAEGRKLSEQLAIAVLSDCTLRVTAATGGPMRPDQVNEFRDGRNTLRVAPELDGTVAIEGYDGEQRVWRSSYPPATAARDIAAAINRAAAAATRAVR